MEPYSSSMEHWSAFLLSIIYIFHVYEVGENRLDLFIRALINCILDKRGTVLLLTIIINIYYLAMISRKDFSFEIDIGLLNSHNPEKLPVNILAPNDLKI